MEHHQIIPKIPFEDLESLTLLTTPDGHVIKRNVYKGSWKGRQIVVKWGQLETDAMDEHQRDVETKIYHRIIPALNRAMEPCNVLSTLGWTNKIEYGHNRTGLVFPKYKFNLSQKLPILEHDEKMDIMQKLANGVKFLHSLNIVHGDVKPSNVLVNDDFRDIVLCDFGCSRNLEMGITKTTVNHPGFTKLYAPPYHYDGCDVRARPPEMIEKGTWHVSPSDDIYSLGIVFYEVLSEKDPRDFVFRDEVCFHAQGKSVLTPMFDSPLLNRLISQMLQLDRSLRPRIAYICETLDKVASETFDDDVNDSDISVSTPIRITHTYKTLASYMNGHGQIVVSVGDLIEVVSLDDESGFVKVKNLYTCSDGFIPKEMIDVNGGGNSQGGFVQVDDLLTGKTEFIWVPHQS